MSNEFKKKNQPRHGHFRPVCHEQKLRSFAKNKTFGCKIYSNYTTAIKIILQQGDIEKPNNNKKNTS